MDKFDIKTERFQLRVGHWFIKQWRRIKPVKESEKIYFRVWVQSDRSPMRKGDSAYVMKDGTTVTSNPEKGRGPIGVIVGQDEDEVLLQMEKQIKPTP